MRIIRNAERGIRNEKGGCGHAIRIPHSAFRIGTCLVLLLCGKFAAAQTESPLTEKLVVEKVAASIDRAIDYLADKQPPDGGWYRDNQAPNALAILAMLGRGHVPGRGPVTRCGGARQKVLAFRPATKRPVCVFASVTRADVRTCLDDAGVRGTLWDGSQSRVGGETAQGGGIDRFGPGPVGRLALSAAAKRRRSERYSHANRRLASGQ